MTGAGAGVDSVVCGACGARNEVPEGTRPPCEACGVSLRLGTLAPPVEEVSAGAGVDSVVCDNCGARNEVPEGTRPPCKACGASLRLGMLAPPVEEVEAEEVAPRSDDGELTPAAPGHRAAPGSGRSEAREPCRCERGGPRPDDPAVCFRCGGALPASDVPRDDGSAGARPADPVSRPAASGPSDARTPCCTLVLSDGHRVRVGPGLLISGDASYDAHPGALFIDSRTVSRKHAWLREHRGRAEVVDLGSTNGTWIEDARIGAFRAAEIGPGARVRISFGHDVRAALEFGSIGEVRE